jgi:hypothetical protein
LRVRVVAEDVPVFTATKGFRVRTIRLHNVQQLLSISISLMHMLTMHFHLHLPAQNILKRIWKSKMNKCTPPAEPNGAAKYLQRSDRSLILLLKSRLSEPSSTFPSPLYSFYWFCCHRNHRPPCFSAVCSLPLLCLLELTRCRRCVGQKTLYLKIYVGIVDIIFVRFVEGLLIKRVLRWELLKKGGRGKGAPSSTCE